MNSWWKNSSQHPKKHQTVVVQVPDGYTAGDSIKVSFDVEIPEGLEPGDSFKVAAPRESKRSSDLQVRVPDGYVSGDELTLDYRGKLFNVDVPHGCGPGDRFTCRAPNNTFFQRASVRVSVPEGKSAGDRLTVAIPDEDGFKFKVTIPEGVQAGESFMTAVPTAQEACAQMAEDEAQKKASRREKQAAHDAAQGARKSARNRPSRDDSARGLDEPNYKTSTLWNSTSGVPVGVDPGLLRVHTETWREEAADSSHSKTQRSTLSYDGQKLYEVETREMMDPEGMKVDGESHTAELSEDYKLLVVTKTSMKHGVDRQKEKRHSVADMILELTTR